MCRRGRRSAWWQCSSRVRRQLTGEAYGVTVRLNNILDLWCITASHCRYDRHPSVITGGQHIGIALTKPFQRQGEATEFIAHIGIHTSEVPYHLRLKTLQDGWQVRLQGSEVGRIICAIRKLEVEAALRFAERIVFLTV